MRHILYVSLLLLSSQVLAQEIRLARQLIGSGYTEFGNGTDFSLSASVGEAITATSTSTDLIITHGFQQSNYILANPLIADLVVEHAACLGANDGGISISFVSNQLAPPLAYAWSTGDTSAGLAQLQSGVYSVTITGSNGVSVTNTTTVQAIDSVDCVPHFYTGITPNNDNNNDYWHIDNVDFFNSKEVQIFNRHGALIWESKEYDNFANSFAGNHKNGNALPVGTYYYMAKFDDSKYRGWLEISK